MSRFGRFAWRNLRGVAVALLIVAAFFGVLAYGGTLTFSYAIVEILVAASAAAWVITWSGDDHPSLWLLWLPVAPLLLCCLQVAPLPQRMVERLSPDAFAAQVDCQRLPGMDPRSCLSVYPEATWRAGIQIALFSLAGSAMMALASTKFAARAFAIAVAGLGLLEWGIGLWFRHSRDERAIYGWHDMFAPYLEWHTSSRWPVLHTSSVCEAIQVAAGKAQFVISRYEVGDVCGSFVVSNHFAGCLELCLPFALALCLTVGTRASGWPLKSLCLLTSVAMVAAVLWTLLIVAGSRAGGAAFLLAALTVFWANAQRRWSRGIWFGLIVVYLLAILALLILVAVQGDAIASRADFSEHVEGSLRYAIFTIRARMAWWGSCFSMFFKAPLLGIGLGGFGALVPGYAPRDIVYWYFAHNDYAQFLAETGLVGVGMIIASLWVLRKVVVGAKAIERSNEGSESDESWGGRAISVGSIGALAGIALHSLFDWNLHVPANALLATLAAGLWLAGRVGAAKAEADGPATPTAMRPAPAAFWPIIRLRLAQAGVVGIVSLGAWSAGRELLADPPIERARERLEHIWKPGDDRAATLDRLATLTPSAEPAALGSGSWNADYAKLIGDAYLQLSGGRHSPQLILAYEWLSRALERRPVDKTLHETLEQIQAIWAEREKNRGAE